MKKHFVFVLAVLLLSTFLFVVGCGQQEKPAATETSQESTIPQSSPVQTQPQTRTVDDFFSIDNIKEAQQLVVGPSVISGTAKRDGFTLTLNDKPVGIPADTKNFLPTYDIVEGRNLLKFRATDSTGQTYDKWITVIGIQPAPPAVPAENITLAEYNQIQNDMTYQQVVSIVGGAGLNTADIPNFGVEPPPNGANYIFFGNNPGNKDAAAVVTFMDGVVIGKYQNGLI
jgi:hypothetical protein